MTSIKTLYTPFYTNQQYCGPCSKCGMFTLNSYALGVDLWREGVLTSTRTIKGHDNLCAPCFYPFRHQFEKKTDL